MSDQAVMFPHRIRRTLDELSVGEEAWTSPDALLVDEDNRCWLSLLWVAHSYAHLSYTMRVVRDEYGFIVDISDVPSDFGWFPGEYDCHGDDCLPVLVLVEDREEEDKTSAESLVKSSPTIAGVAWNR